MTTLKNYYITVKAHEIRTVTYKVNAKDKEHAEQLWMEGESTTIDETISDIVSETIESIDER